MSFATSDDRHTGPVSMPYFAHEKVREPQSHSKELIFTVMFNSKPLWPNAMILELLCISIKAGINPHKALRFMVLVSKAPCFVWLALKRTRGIRGPRDPMSASGHRGRCAPPDDAHHGPGALGVGPVATVF